MMPDFVFRGDARSLNQQQTTEPLAILRPFASLGFNMFNNNTPIAGIKDKKSGIVFDGEFCLKPGGRNYGSCPRITGTGVRTKKIAGIKSLDVYALGLYVDEAAVRHALHKYANSDASALVKNQAVYDEVAKGSFEKSLVLVITSKLVKNRNFVDALNERLAPPLNKSGESQALNAFKSQFDSVKFRSGLQISFTFKGNKLITKADGREIGSINNKALSSTLLDIYLGRDPVSRAAKESFGLGLARMIKS